MKLTATNCLLNLIFKIQRAGQVNCYKQVCVCIPVFCIKSVEHLPCGDGSYIIILNTKCAQEKVPQELQGLFHYINTEEVDEGDWFVEMIHQMVLRYQSDEEVANMATLEEEYLRKNTLAERKGRAEGEERVNKLNKLLVEAGRTDDLQKAIVDSEYQQALFKEFGL